jgi:hypothetical protein
MVPYPAVLWIRIGSMRIPIRIQLFISKRPMRIRILVILAKKAVLLTNFICLGDSVADPDPGPGAFLTPGPGSGIGFFPDPGSQPHIFRA